MYHSSLGVRSSSFPGAKDDDLDLLGVVGEDSLDGVLVIWALLRCYGLLLMRAVSLDLLLDGYDARGRGGVSIE